MQVRRICNWTQLPCDCREGTQCPADIVAKMDDDTSNNLEEFDMFFDMFEEDLSERIFETKYARFDSCTEE